jgi:predicted dehydrogenase/threonine dehydrogenase-like Zn-dependent dehydrogenase
MKQLLQNMRNGKVYIEEIPVPKLKPGTALVQNAFSLISAGTERMVTEFAGKNLVGKARSRPDLVGQVLDKARRDGIIPTLVSALNRLDQPMVMGYSSAGTILNVSSELSNFKPGDRVACAGGNYAVHAEYAVVPKNLLTLLPDGVDFESAAFSTLGAIALQGFRLAGLQLGESVAVIGLGLLGLLTVQIALSAGCHVLGIDIDPKRIELGKKLGYNAILRSDSDENAMSYTHGHGFDAVLICADSRSSDPVELAGKLARDHGKVIAVGAVGLNLPRKIYYEKEIIFQVSRSYGPGRYDPKYEENGQDYPYGYVRWTEGRNMEAFVELIASQKVNVHPLISHRFPIENAPQAYQLITGKAEEPFLGVLIQYPFDSNPPSSTRIDRKEGLYKNSVTPATKVSLGVFGAGNYANATFLPVVKKAGNTTLVGIASASGVTATNAANKFGFQFVTSSENEILEDPNINTVLILTQHNFHAPQVIKALSGGKHVYCEKPLALNLEELSEIEELLKKDTSPLLTVGLNRRFAPLARQLKDFLADRSEPLFAHYQVNAGYLPLTHWLHDPQRGGGRIIGEGCHFIDFLTFLVGAPPVTVSGISLPDQGRYQKDNVVLDFRFPDGSIGSISYMANGDKSYSKEQVQVFCAGKVAFLDDFRRLELVKNGNRKILKPKFNQDKGHFNAWNAFINSITQAGNVPPIPYGDIFGVSRASFAAMEAINAGKEISF